MLNLMFTAFPSSLFSTADDHRIPLLTASLLLCCTVAFQIALKKGMSFYPVSLVAVGIRLAIHRFLRYRVLNSGEVLALGLFEGTQQD